MDDYYFFVNNPTEEVFTATSTNTVIRETEYNYTYNSMGYPVSRSDVAETVTYEYYD